MVPATYPADIKARSPYWLAFCWRVDRMAVVLDDQPRATAGVEVGGVERNVHVAIDRRRQVAGTDRMLLDFAIQLGITMNGTAVVAGLRANVRL